MRIVFVVMLVLLGVTNQPKVAEAANTINGVTFDSENVTVDYDGNYHQPVFTVSDTSGTYSMTYTYVDEDTYENTSSTDLPQFRKPGTHSVTCKVTNQTGKINVTMTSVVTINNPLKMGAISVEPVDYTFQVSWDAVSGVGRYQIVYSTTEDFASATTETVGSTVTTRVMTSTDIQSNTTYYVKVIPMLTVGTAYYPGTASDVCSVTTNVNTDALPNLKNYDDGDSTVTEWKIEDAADFAKLNNTFSEDVTIYLTKDLMVSSSIADFEYATLYGQGHTVKLSAATIANTPVTGLFQYVNEGTISDLNVEANYSVSTANEKDGEYDSGIIVGMMTGGLIYNCTSQGSVTNGIEGSYTVNVGGIVGAASGTMIACCTNLADVSFKGSSTYTTESTYVGGIAGRIDAETQVLWCYEKSGSLLNQNTFGKACYTSGIVGYIADSSSVLYSSFCEANVSSSTSTGVDPITYVDSTNTDRVKGCYYYQKLLVNSACRSNSGAAGITVIATKEEALKAAWDMNTSITLGGETGANLAVWGVSADTNLPYIVSSDNEATYRVTFVKSDGSENEYAYANGQDTVTYSYTDEKNVYELEKIQIGDKTYQAVDGQCEFTMPIKDCEAEVTLKEIEYSIVYHLNGGENNALNPDTYTYSSGFTLGNAVRNGYTFLGWYQEEECSGERVNAIAQGTTGNVELWAKWEANSYTISFADDDLNLEEITATYESDISDKKPENPTSDEYVFDGWYTDQELQEEFTFDTMPAKDVVLYAKWSKVSIEDVDVADIANGIYSGKEYEPALELKYRDELLVAEQDYTVEYTDNVNAGTAKAVIMGMKKYTGSREVTFTIEKNPEGFALEQSTYNAVYGDDAFTLTITKNGTGAVTYQSDNEDMLTVDKEGTVTILGAGTANVTVTMAEDSNYKKTEKTAKITVAVKEHAGTDHTLELRSQRDATCNQEGFTGNQYCTECGLLVEKGTSIAKLSHEYEQTGLNEATCGTAGSITYRCKLCGDTYSDAIPATGNHQTELRNVKEATCSAEGYTGDIVCKVCGKTQESGTTISKRAHTPGEEKSRVEPTCVATGKRYVVCSVCGNVYSEILPATGVHNTELRNQREATYSSTGYTGDLYCKDCGKLIESGTTIAKKEQSASSGEEGTSSSETKSPTSGSGGGNAAQQTSGSNGGSSGTASQTVTTKVSATKIISAKNSKSKRIVVKYKKVSGAKYEISYGTKKNFKGAKVKTTNKTSYTIKGLKKGKTYYVRVRAYKTVNGKKVYSKYTTKKKVVVKK
jgi:uncharacterized repeat protein (TIGR02543 family)